MQKKLTRGKDKMLTGVCAGIAHYFDMDPTLVRVGYALLTVLTSAFPGILLYIIMSIVVPAQPDQPDWNAGGQQPPYQQPSQQDPQQPQNGTRPPQQ